MILRTASAIYGAGAAWRRRWYSDPARQRRLRLPVISVGNLSVGGSGKTPVVAHLARLLAARGERPCILSRGYGRQSTPDRVTVVSDGKTVLAGLDASGDEPLMLARALAGVPVLVGSSRYDSGRFAEAHLAVTVHLLDDGFQHFQLARDVDLLVVDEDDLQDLPMPAGRLREPLAVARQADAALVTSGRDEVAERVGRALGVPTVFRVVRSIGAPRLVVNGASVGRTDEPVFAVAGVARPERFFADLASAGWKVAGSMTFGDHHVFTERDIARLMAAARSAGAAMVMTTDKDAVRLEATLEGKLEGRGVGGVPVAAVPLTVQIEPAAAFADWLLDRLQAARRSETAESLNPLNP